MAENEVELRITGVEVTEYRSGIPLQGWESVANALHTYASGRTRSYFKTHLRQIIIQAS